MNSIKSRFFCFCRRRCFRIILPLCFLFNPFYIKIFFHFQVDDVDGDVDEGDVADVDVSKKQIKRPAEQVTKTKALRDRHTLTARDLGDIPALIDSGNVANTNNVDSKKVVPTSSKNDVCDKNFAALVEKYSTNERVTMEGKFLTARSVFESTNVSGNAPTTSTKATFRPSS